MRVPQRTARAHRAHRAHRALRQTRHLPVKCTPFSDRYRRSKSTGLQSHRARAPRAPRAPRARHPQWSKKDARRANAPPDKGTDGSRRVGGSTPDGAPQALLQHGGLAGPEIQDEAFSGNQQHPGRKHASGTPQSTLRILQWTEFYTDIPGLHPFPMVVHILSIHVRHSP